MSRKKRGGIKMSGYSHHGASRQKPSMLKWNATSKSPHEDISENLHLLRERSRDLYAGAPLGRGAVERIVLNALGNGLRLNCRIDPSVLGLTDQECRDAASAIEGRFDWWASSKDCDYSRMMNFYELQQLALRCVLLDGDCFAIADTEGERFAVMLIEGDRVQTPLRRPSGKMIDEGIELDVSGRPCAYWIANRHPDSELMNQPLLEWRRVRAFAYGSGRRQVLHLMPFERIGQRRGVPFLAPVMEQLKQVSRYTDAELMAAVVSGMYAVFFEHSPREDGDYGEEEYATEENFGETPGYEGMTAENMYGAVMDLPEGVHPVGISPGRPNQNFTQFVESLVKQVGGALGLPAELLFMQFTSSYSASRGALLEAWKLFRYWRKWFAENFCQPVYEQWLDLEVQRGTLRLPGYEQGGYVKSAYAWAEWVGPSQGQLNPVQEVTASVMKIENGLSTYEREAGELTGEDWDLIVKQRQREEKIKKEAGIVVQD